MIHKEDNVDVALCPELDIASQGTTLEEARANLIEAVELFFEAASHAEIGSRLHDKLHVTPVKVKVG
ncbi:MAG: type II toxin-antitoxin system HicB family antitoxin [Phycisphaerales bacterium]|nr:type II toxin-antitoxin system HicB family antitoxin [Phycisphaerales bacterium]